MFAISGIGLDGQAIRAPAEGARRLFVSKARGKWREAEEWLVDDDDMHHGLSFALRWPSDDLLKKAREAVAELNALAEADVQAQIRGEAFCTDWHLPDVADEYWALDVDVDVKREPAMVVHREIGERNEKRVAVGEPFILHRRVFKGKLRFANYAVDWMRSEEDTLYLDQVAIALEKTEF